MSPSIRSITTTPWVRALAILLIAFVAACSGEGDAAANKAPPPPDDPAFPGTPVSDALSSLQGTCTIANKVASFPVAANETVILGRANSPTTTGGTVYNLTANGRVLACGSTNATVGGTTATVTQVAIDLNDTGSIIVDYSNGAFLPGGSAAGIAITGHGGTAYVKVKGTTAADKIYVAGTAA
ncbi:MAG: hypothetical protein JST92_27720, partial [Deltaproteobacteria bacterium]|nr:hypothetical protein [Deltaproteobacteria bacterium]